MTGGTGKPADEMEATRVIVDAIAHLPPDAQRRAIRWAQEKLGLIQEGAGDQGRSRGDDVAPPRTRNIKTFVDEKKPGSDVGFATAVAYFYAFEAPQDDRKAEISAADLQNAARLADRGRLTDPNKTLHNAAQRGYLDKGSGKGAFRINPVGENLVAMAMPGGAGDGKVRRKASPKARPRKTKKARRS